MMHVVAAAAAAAAVVVVVVLFMMIMTPVQLDHETSLLKQSIAAAEQQRDATKASNFQLQATVTSLQASLNERCRDLSSSVAQQSTTAAENRCKLNFKPLSFPIVTRPQRPARAARRRGAARTLTCNAPTRCTGGCQVCKQTAAAAARSHQQA